VKDDAVAKLRHATLVHKDPELEAFRIAYSSQTVFSDAGVRRRCGTSAG